MRYTMAVGLISLSAQGASAIPPGFVEETVISGVNEPVGLAFGPDRLMYVWQKDGIIRIYRDAQVVNPLLFDLRDEVNTFWTRGMTGLALDPDFANNGYIYLAYTVDWEYYITGGNPDQNNLDTTRDTFGRIVRYTLDANSGFTTVVDNSRWIMIGQTHNTGFPVTFASHTQDSIVFASDGTMLISGGDGASMSGVDVGGPRSSCCSTNTAEIDGILSEKEQIGAFRSQLVDTHAGKILRVDPATAEGVQSNPFYDANDPSSPRSRVWVLGLRNPFAFGIRPETGSDDPADGNPGVLVIGDVGWDNWERLNVATTGGQNMGWPRFEGLINAPGYSTQDIANLDAPNPLFDGGGCAQEFFFFNDLIVQETQNAPSFPNPCNSNVQIDEDLTFMNTRAALAWRNGRQFNPLTMVPIFNDNGFAVQVPIDNASSPVEGPHLAGIGTVGGTFYSGNKFPDEYQGAYFFADSGGNGQPGWIMAATFNKQHALERVWEFRADDVGLSPTHIVIDPEGYGVYFTNLQRANAGEIRRIVVDCNGNGQGDDLDIDDGLSEDANGNGVPDECEGCLADLDGDEDADADDFFAYLDLFASGDSGADLDEDGDADADDFFAYLDLFAQGC